MGTMKNLAGVILCGGKSSRMRFPKALLPYGNSTMLNHMVNSLSALMGEVCVVASPDQNLPDLPESTKVVRDEVAFQGPLNAMCLAFQALSSFEYCFVTATDTPLLKRDVIKTLYTIVTETGADLIMPQGDSFYYPLSAVYRRQPVVEEMQHLLALQRHRPVFLMEKLNGLTISVEEFRNIDPNLDSFRNVNSRQDYRDLLHLMNQPVPPEFQPRNVLVEFFGVIRKMTETSSLQLKADTFEDIVRQLSELFPSLNGSVINGNHLNNAFRMVRNANEFITDFSQELNLNDTIQVISSDAGG